MTVARSGGNPYIPIIHISEKKHPVPRFRKAIDMPNVLTNPEQFFSELSARDTNLKTPFLIVLVAAIIPAISEAVMYCRYFRMASSAWIDSAVDASWAFALPFIIWFLYAGMFYAASVFMGGEGSFIRVLEFAGYGFLPLIASAVVAAVTVNWLLPTMSQPIVYDAVSITTLLLALWCMGLWTVAVKHARNLSTSNALATVVGGVVAGFMGVWGVAYLISGSGVGV